MQGFEYIVRSDFHDAAENAARAYGSRESERLKAYETVLTAELNKLGSQGWELVSAPDAASNRNWIFKRPRDS